MKHFTLILIIFIVLISSRVIAISYEIDQLTFSTLPPHCQAFFAQLQKRGKLKGLALKNPDKYKPKLWGRRIGQPWTFMNHYCPGLAALNKAKISGKQGNLSGIAGDIEYLIKRSSEHSSWSKANSWLRAEAYMKLAEVADLEGDAGKAIRQYHESIKTYPQNYRAYVGLSKLLDKSGNREKALEVIRQGIKAVPKSKTLKRQEKRLLGES